MVVCTMRPLRTRAWPAAVYMVGTLLHGSSPRSGRSMSFVGDGKWPVVERCFSKVSERSEGSFDNLVCQSCTIPKPVLIASPGSNQKKN